MNARAAVGAVAVLAGAAIAAVLWTNQADVEPAVAPPPRTADATGSGAVDGRNAPQPRAGVAEEPVAEAFDGALAALRDAIAAGAAAPAAADLRRLLRTDPGAFAAAQAVLLDDGTDGDLRRALAMVLGTLPLDGVDDALLAALERYGDDQATALALIAALGALRDPPDEDDVFDLEQAPFFGVPGPGGMGITVRNVIREPRVEETLGRLLLDRERPAVRLAAASALQWSLDREFSRTRFRTALTNEMSDAVAAVLGEALGLWSRQKQGLEPDRIVAEVVTAADRPGFTEYRLRLETALQQAAFGEATAGQLRQWTHPGNPFELRSFALTALACQRTIDDATRAALVAAVRGDADAAMRRHAARLLGRIPGSEDATAALRAAFAQTVDWSLRATALSSLVATLPAAEARTLLERARADVDPRIARRAERLRPPVR